MINNSLLNLTFGQKLYKIHSILAISSSTLRSLTSKALRKDNIDNVSSIEINKKKVKHSKNLSNEIPSHKQHNKNPISSNNDEFSHSNKLMIGLLAKKITESVRKRTKEFEQIILNRIVLDSFMKFLTQIGLKELTDSLISSNVTIKQLITLSNTFRPVEDTTKQEMFDHAIEFLRNITFYINHHQNCFDTLSSQKTQKISPNSITNENCENKSKVESSKTLNDYIKLNKIILSKSSQEFRSLINDIDSKKAYAVFCNGTSQEIAEKNININQLYIQFINHPEMAPIQETSKFASKSYPEYSQLIAINRAIEIADEMNIKSLYIFCKNKKLIETIFTRANEYQRKYLPCLNVNDIKMSKNNKFENILRSISISILYKDIHLVQCSGEIEKHIKNLYECDT